MKRRVNAHFVKNLVVKGIVQENVQMKIIGKIAKLHIKLEKDKEKRNILAHTVHKVMINLNPEIKNQTNYEQTVWDHMHEIANYELDIDNDYPAPEPEAKDTKPDHLGYKATLSKYRYYGRNLIDMIDGAKDMEDGDLKTMYINYIASFMTNSSRNWNDEELTNFILVEHIKVLSGGKLIVNPDELIISFEPKRKMNVNLKNPRRHNGKNRNKGNNRRRF